MYPRRMLLWLVIATGLLLLLASGQQAAAVTIRWQAANTEITLGLPSTALEFENPLSGTETVLGYQLVEWRDADYSWVPPNPPNYDDWTVSHPGVIDGNPNEIWMRTAGHSIWTTTSQPGTMVSIHMTGDDNDGLAQVMVDGIEVARLDMYASPNPQSALIIVKSLSNTTHTITINDLGVDPQNPQGDDVHAFGAGTVQLLYKWNLPPQPTQPPNVFYGWNEVSWFDGPRIAADDWVCTDTTPVTRIRWWGSHLGWTGNVPPPDAPSTFQLAIWTDVPVGIEPFSHPGQVLWTVTVPAPVPQFAGWDYDPVNRNYEAAFVYDLALNPSQWFQQQPPVPRIYWLSISAVYSGQLPTHTWGWKTRPRDPLSPAPDDAVRIFAPTSPQVGMAYQFGEPIFWPTPAESFDLAFELWTQSMETQTKWSQRPKYNPASPYSQCFWGWDERSIRASQQLVADDWICGDTRPITDIHWWGSYKGWDGPGPPTGVPLPTNFVISLWTDFPGPPFSHPQQCVKAWVVSRSELNETPVGCDFYPTPMERDTTFYYTWLMPQSEWWTQPGQNTVYWISIAAVYSGTVPPQYFWGWKTRLREGPAPDAAVRMTEPLIPTPGSTWISGSAITNPEGQWDACFLLTTQGPTQPVLKWSQPPANWTPPDAFNGWNEPSIYGGPQIAADDWVCQTDQPVTDIHWWGSYVGWGQIEPPAGALVPFNIAIWTDVPVGPNDPYSHPGQVIWQTTCTNYTWEFVGWDFDPRNPNAPPEACFKFTQILDPSQWFYQQPGPNIYWLSIAAQAPAGQTEYPFGWKTVPRVNGQSPDDAVRIFDPTAPLMGAPWVSGEPIEYPAGQSWDFAFALTTQEQPLYDYGDAPDPTYPTLFASNGARHGQAGFWLGNMIDYEPNGLPNATATGDDTTNLADEDGVVFNTPLSPGQNARITVTLGGAPIVGAFLTAWIDWGADGSWATPGDLLFPVFPLIPGPNTINFLVPPNATPGAWTFARFRLHTNPGGVAETGFIPYGEVEDYRVRIGNVSKWTQQPHPPQQGFDAPSDYWWPQPAPGYKWIQRPNPLLPGLHAHDWDYGSGVQRVVLADDWLCSGGDVTDVHWYGNYEVDDQGVERRGSGIAVFEISLHFCAPQPGPWCVPADPAILLQPVPFMLTNETDTGLVNNEGSKIYEYTVILPQPFPQQAGNWYWVDVVALSNQATNPALWRWQEARREPAPPLGHAPAASRFHLNPWQSITWPTIPGQPELLTDLAFGVTSQAQPPIPVNKHVADDFRSDGRPIRALRWWGSYFDERYAPGLATDPFHVLDGWFISFHPDDPNGTCPPGGLTGGVGVLAVYFAPASAVTIEPLPNWIDCNGHQVYRYLVDLDRCCLLCSQVDPRTGNRPGQAEGFLEELGVRYWLDIVAVTGVEWMPPACLKRLTGHVASDLNPDGHFWGWHSSPATDPPYPALKEACTGQIMDLTPFPPNCWVYDGWVKQPWLCLTPPPHPPVHMAFELLTDSPPTAQACCLPNGECLDVPPGDCMFIHGGDPQGPGSTCGALSPWIRTQPQSVSECEGNQVTFTVLVCATPPVSYQWFKAPATPVGVNSPTYTIPAVQLTDAGNYYVRITDGAAAVATSNQATLTVWDRGTGDADYNGIVNGEDIQEFVNVLLGADTDPHRVCVCDMNGDNSVTSADIPAFVDRLLGI